MRTPSLWITLVEREFPGFYNMKFLRAVAVLTLIALPLVGCQIPYLLKNSWHQTKILKSRTDISDILKDPKTPDSIKQKLRLVQQAREFSNKVLGLKESENYTTYVDLKRRYVTWVVRASPKHKLEPYQWWFPITGNVPYKGYFTRDDAEREAKSLKNKNLDTYIRGVTAYSTLGWFEDPVLNTMMSYEDYDLVNLIIHETVHATLFIKDQVDFNEQLATFIGNKGAELFFKNRSEGQGVLKTAQLENQDLSVFSGFITRELAELKKWYDNEDEKIILKKRPARLQKIIDTFTNEVEPQLKTPRFLYFKKLRLNNALLLSYETYQSNLDQFEKLYNKLGRNFQKLMAWCKKLESSKDPQYDLEKFIESKTAAAQL